MRPVVFALLLVLLASAASVAHVRPPAAKAAATTSDAHYVEIGNYPADDAEINACYNAASRLKKNSTTPVATPSARAITATSSRWTSAARWRKNWHCRPLRVGFCRKQRGCRRQRRAHHGRRPALEMPQPAGKKDARRRPDHGTGCPPAHSRHASGNQQVDLRRPGRLPLSLAGGPATVGLPAKQRDLRADLQSSDRPAGQGQRMSGACRECVW